MKDLTPESNLKIFMKIILQWAGTVPTSVYPERVGAQVEVMPGETVEVIKDVADELVKMLPFEVVGMANKSDAEVEARKKEILANVKTLKDQADKQSEALAKAEKEKPAEAAPEGKPESEMTDEEVEAEALKADAKAKAKAAKK